MYIGSNVLMRLVAHVIITNISQGFEKACESKVSEISRYDNRNIRINVFRVI